MKLIIDINDNEYMGIKEHPVSITSYPVTIHLYDEVRNGKPLKDMLEEIKTEIEHMIPCDKEALSMKLGVLEILDKYMAERKK